MSEQNDTQVLKYRTRGNANPQGRPRVYFCCHREDFERTFKPITDELLEIRKNAAVWYRDPELPFPTDPQFLEDLRQMQLFVIPVTWRFLFLEDPARTVEMDFAVRNHIPILPLMQEPGLANDFNHICGDLQFLDKTAAASDRTALPYEEKLKKFLDSVLVGDEMAARIRAAFDAYIFLSYRKKDRAFAQQIMRLIHSSEFCQDVAIWYDEFLTPGENFNNEIEAAMKKSALFALVVTPSLLEDPNYVQTTEYPAAVKMKKDVLPIMAKLTDDKQLAKMYEGIRASIPTDDPEKIAKRLHELLTGIALRANDSDPAHMFLIGLAYLAGIDVEVDHPRALRLINRAAEAGLPAARKKLVAMYQNGEGVERNYHTAIEKQKEYVSLLQKLADEDPSYENGRDVALGFWDLGDYQAAVGDLTDAKESYLRLMSQCLKMQQYRSWETMRHLAVAYEKLGKICESEGELQRSRAWCEMSLDLRTRMTDAIGTVETRRDLTISYEYLGDICSAEGNLSEARSWYEKELEICRELAEETGTPENRQDLSVCYEKLGDISKAEGNLSEARSWYEKELEICRELAEETGTPEDRRSLAVVYEKLGSISFDEENLTEARDLFEKDLEISLELAQETGTLEARRDLAVAYSKLGDFCEAEGDPDEARSWYEKDLEISLALVKETRTVRARDDLADTYEKLGDISMEKEDLDEAESLYQKSLLIRQALRDETGTVEAQRDTALSYGRLGDVSAERGDLPEARSRYEKSLEIILPLAENPGTVELRRDLSIAYCKLGEISEEEGDLSRARNLYEKDLEITLAIAEEIGTVESLRDLIISYEKLENICITEGKISEARIRIEKKLEVTRQLADMLGTAEERRDLALVYAQLGEILKDEGDLSGAGIQYEKTLEVFQSIADETGTAEARRDLAITFGRIGDIRKEQGDLNEAQKQYEKSLKLRKCLAEEADTEKSPDELTAAYDDLAVAYHKLGTLSILPTAKKREYLEEFVWICRQLCRISDRDRYRKFLSIGQKELEKLQGK